MADEITQEGFKNVKIHGLWIGAPGVISKEACSLFRSLGFSKNQIEEISKCVVMLSYVLYQASIISFNNETIMLSYC